MHARPPGKHAPVKPNLRRALDAEEGSTLKNKCHLPPDKEKRRCARASVRKARARATLVHIPTLHSRTCMHAQNAWHQCAPQPRLIKITTETQHPVPCSSSSS